MWGNLAAFLERLDDEWNGSLKVDALLYCFLPENGLQLSGIGAGGQHVDSCCNQEGAALLQ